jgi:hypothetical protein
MPDRKSIHFFVYRLMDLSEHGLFPLIDYGPDFDEIRDSIQNGTVVTFGSSSGEKVRCVVLDAKMDHSSGRAALMLEEESTSNFYFARYTHTGGRWSCGDLVTWRLKLNEIEELRRDVA